MYCGKCGCDGNKIITEKMEQDGNIITIYYFGICQNCGELLGFKEVFKSVDWGYIDIETIKKELDKTNKL